MRTASDASHCRVLAIRGAGEPRRGFVDFPFASGKFGEMTGAIYDTAYKGAVTDGMKRCMRIMGAQFGNSLYGGGECACIGDCTATAAPDGVRAAVSPSGMGAHSRRPVHRQV